MKYVAETILALLGAALVTVGIVGPISNQAPAPEPDSAFAAGVMSAPAAGLTIDGTVVRAIDGDTIVVTSSVEYHVRLLDCWAPESRSRDLQEKSRGLKAKARMTELTQGKSVRVFLPASGSLTEMFTLGRLLGRAWILDPSGQPCEVDLSTTMVAEQLATRQKETP
jgi:endonuclease YncB( thermonuclease family)